VLEIVEKYTFIVCGFLKETEKSREKSKEY
jgi:hypothetical protein